MEADKVVRDGIHPAGPAVPAADPTPSPGVLGPGVRWVVPEPNAGPTANPAIQQAESGQSADPSQTRPARGAFADPRVLSPLSQAPAAANLTQPRVGSSAGIVTATVAPGVGASPITPPQARGASADPHTGIPNIPVEVTIAPFGVQPGAGANIITVAPNAGPTAAPFQHQQGTVKPIREMSPETFIGRTATPHLLNAIEGVSAEVRARGPVTASANPTPSSQVTISVPPAFPVDPKEAFSRVDEELELPPRQRTNDRPVVPVVPDNSISTEQEVANSYLDSSRDVNLERWAL